VQIDPILLIVTLLLIGYGLVMTYSTTAETRTFTGDPMQFVNRQIDWFAINLPRAGKDNPGMRAKVATGFEQLELRRAIQLHIHVRINHRVKMANAPGQVENEVHPADQVIDHALVPHVPFDQFHPTANVIDVVSIATLSRHKSVENGDFDIINLDEFAGQVTTYESRPACDQHGTAFVFTK